MNRLACLLTLALSLACGVAWAQPGKIEQRCRLEDGSTVLLRSTSSLDGKLLFLELDGRLEPAFSDMPTSDFVGELKMAVCKSKVLVFALSFGSPYLKGVVIRRRSSDKQPQRIDFAEKALPQWLYLGPGGMRLVLPNQGNELSTRFVVYRYDVQGGQPDEATGANKLPNEPGFRLLTLRR